MNPMHIMVCHVIHAHTIIQEIEKLDCPEKRGVTQRAACCLGFNTNNPHLLLCGGRPPSGGIEPPHDISILDMESKTWKKVNMHVPCNVQL